jgi:peptide/nickel transport system permease protein
LIVVPDVTGSHTRLHARLGRMRVRWRDRWAVFRAGRIGVIGLVIIALFAAAALLHPILLATVWDPATYDPVTGHSAPAVELEVVERIADPRTQIDVQRARLRHDPQARVGDTVVALVQPARPSWQHPLGTDPRGRDILSQLMFGARTAFAMAGVSAVTTVLIATTIGALAAFYRGWIESTLMRVADVFLLLPAIPLLIFLTTLHEVGVVTIGLVFGLVSGLGPTAIVLKSHAQSVAVRPFMDAARGAGGSGPHLILRHLVPNVLPLSMLYTMFTVTGAIGAEAILSLFGLIDVPMSWGIMIHVADTGGYTAQGFAYWWLLVPAGLAVTLLAGAFYLVGRGLDEVLDPRRSTLEGARW